MRFSTSLFIYVASGCVALQMEKRACGDNCARAVIDTRRGELFVSSARNDCSSFLLASTSSVIPAYASSCSGAESYSTACYCFNILTITTTGSDSISISTRSSSTMASSTLSLSVITSVPAPPSNSTSTPSSTSTSSSKIKTPTMSSTIIGYYPPLPTSYVDCQFDPNNSTQVIELIDLETGISFIDVDNRAVLAINSTDNTNLTEYHFEPSSDEPLSVFDLVSETGEFVALFNDGHIGFVPTSSQRQVWAPGPDYSTYITALWSVDCDGNLLLGIIGGYQYELVLGGDDLNELWAQPLSPSVAKRAIKVIPLGVFIKSLLHGRTDLEIDQPRCPPGDRTSPVDKWMRRGVTKNGCGSGKFIVNEVPFQECCDDHDECYDQCYNTYLGCNTVFAECTYRKATEAYPGIDLGSEVRKLGYQRLARIFAWIVESEIGRLVFDSANSERCACCKEDEEDCSSGCSNPFTDAQNCGQCGIVCESSVCENGACSVESCDGSVCGAFVSGCNGSDSCYCFTNAEGNGFCAPDASCLELADCSISADCGAGSVCIVESCCSRNVCLPALCGNPTAKAMTVLEGKELTGASGNTTAAKRGTLFLE